MLSAAVSDQIGASAALVSTESERALLMLYRHGPALTLPVIETEIGFWNLPARFVDSPEQMSGLCDAITWQQSGFWLNHVNQCRELFSDKEQGFVRTARSTAMFTVGGTVLRKATALPEMLLGKVGSLWRQAVEHERVIMAMLFVVSCEFVPRMAREVASQVDLHMQLCAVGGTAVATGGDAQASDATPDTWTRGAWIAAAVGAHMFFVTTLWWEIHPIMRKIIFDDV